MLRKSNLTDEIIRPILTRNWTPDLQHTNLLLYDWAILANCTKLHS